MNPALLSASRARTGGGKGYPTGRDIFLQDVVCRLKFDGADGATTTTDTSPLVGSPSRVWTFNGNAQIDDAQSVFGGTSLRLDGTGDFLSTPHDPLFNLGDYFSIEFWVRWNALVGAADYDSFAAKTDNPSTQSSYMVLVDNGVLGAGRHLDFSYTTDGTNFNNIFVSWTPVINTWYFIQCIRSGTILRFGVDGVQVGTDQTLTATIFQGNAAFAIGRDVPSGGGSPNCWVDDYRITRNIPRPLELPTAAFPDV